MRKLPDFTGQEIGKWRVLEKIGCKSGGTEYRCRCECGRESLILATRLKNAKGCRRCAAKLPDLSIGFQVHNWSVIGKPELLDSKKGIFYKCRCVCGSEKYQSVSRLLSGKTKQCKACAARNQVRHVDDLSGQTFGSWLVLHRVPGGRVTYKCECQCKKTVRDISASALVTGNRNMCARCRRIKNSRRQWRGCGEISAHKWAGINNNAKSRPKEIKVEIGIEYAWDLFLKQKRRCALSGLPIGFKRHLAAGGGGENSASLDRIDSSKGYIEGNVQWIHKHIQKMKWDFDESYFVQMCAMIAENKLTTVANCSKVGEEIRRGEKQ